LFHEPFQESGPRGPDSEAELDRRGRRQAGDA
jgi:hypothetical protein